METIRLNKFLAERLGVSRREADEAIRSGKVTIDDEKATLGARITPGNIDKLPKVCYNGKIVPFDAEFLYLAFNKPVGYVCSRRAQGDAKTLYDLLPKKYHNLKTVGRLDKDSSGLILLTNDGDFAFKMTHPKFRKNKVYEIELDKPLEPLHQQMISDYGVEIGDGLSRFKIIKDKSEKSRQSADAHSQNHNDSRDESEVTSSASRRTNRCDFDDGASRTLQLSDLSYIVILSEGRNRQIRRTFAALGYTVTKLHRTHFGPYELKDLKPGEYVIIKP